MVFVNSKGYLRRRDSKRVWWLIKVVGGGVSGYVRLGLVSFPDRFVGKKVRFKVEMVDDG